MKTILITSILFIWCQLLVSQSQSFLEDVKKIKSIYDIYGTLDYRAMTTTEKDNLFKIFKKYSNKTTQDELANEYGTNEYFTNNGLLEDMPAGLASISTVPSLPGANSPPTPFVSNLIWGATDFLVKRTKEELKITFFDKFSKKVQESPELSTLFSNTSQTLSGIGDDVYNYRLFLTTLQTSFRTDLEGLPNSFANYVETNTTAFEPQERAFIADLLQGSQKFIDNGVNGESIISIISFLAEESRNEISAGNITTANLKLWNIRNSVVLVNIAVAALLENSNTINFIELDHLEAVISDPVASDFFFGLLYQKLITDEVELGATPTSVAHLLRTNIAPPSDSTKKRNVLVSLRSIVQHGNLIDDIQKDLQDLSSYPKQSLQRTNKHYEFINAISTIMKNLIDVFVEDDAIKQNIRGGIDIFGSASRIPLGIKRKQYTSAIVDAITVLEYAIKSDSSGIAKRLRTYGTFIASIAQATDADEISSVIDNYALPVGSYIDKRVDKSNVALNAYVGPWIGFERAKAKDITSLEGSDFSAALTAPIGVAFSGSGKNSKHSFTAFPFLLDLGAPVAFRFGNENLEDLANIEWENIVSPGLQLSWGIPKLFSISGAFQWGPRLRKVTNEDLEIDEVKSIRFGLSFTVDLPVATISRKSH